MRGTTDRAMGAPCPKKYTHPFWQGKHNIVGIYVKGTRVGRRCVSCGAHETVATPLPAVLQAGIDSGRVQIISVPIPPRKAGK